MARGVKGTGPNSKYKKSAVGRARSGSMKAMLLTGSFSIPISNGSLGHFGDMIEKIRAFQKQTGASVSVSGAGGSMTLTKAANSNQIA